MICKICKQVISQEQEFVKDYFDEKVETYHCSCHLEQFGDIKEIEEANTLQYKKTYEQNVGQFSNFVFLIILAVSIILGLVGIIWILV
ncbi:hypothetical protein SCLARK_001563 [Spiroplasma clarkii]|uniref:Phage protein n=1 Tax=Spiroplasma clarkii TaxID=2139 RepID=A0A1Y0L255_9MOLU|nr:hypothetical protein [Spiroplasma clarkii]ARU92067.1 hypothetical protein SCLARK_001563 [Spiroplasma clarkii]ATX71395.1 hypothetical protein SCLAR_v1c10950 [Spiroplasma clarkii]